MMTRRDLIKMGILGASGLVTLPAGGGFGRVSSAFDDQQRSPALQPFVDLLPTLNDLTPIVPQFDVNTIEPYARPFFGANTRCYEVSSEERFVKFHRDLPTTPVWAYADPHAGPIAGPPRLLTFRIQDVRTGQGPGAGILIRHHNNLTTAPRDFGFPTLTAHFHGGHQPSPADGFPHNLTNRPAFFPARVSMAPGQSFDYMHPLRDVGFIDGPKTEAERPSYLWFHDHILDFTGANVYRGLANVVPAFDDIDSGNETDPDPNALRLPSEPFDLSLELQDRTFDFGGALVFDPFNQDGFLGDTFAVNGVVQPYHVVQRRKYRIRFLNGTNSRIFQVFLTNDVAQTFPMTRIATEGGLMAHPIRDIQSFVLAMAERTEVVIDFADPVFNGQKAVYLENRMAQSNGRKPDGPVSRGPKLLQFVITDQPVSDPSRVPDDLRPFASVTASEIAAAKRRTFRFDRSHGVFTINGDPVDLERSLATVPRNTPEIWTLKNDSGGWWHPIHIHSEFMRVLSRRGQTPELFERDGMARKDTILLRGDDSVEVFLKFRDYLGPFVFHCHNLEHEDMAMMGRFDIV
jgi:FtsP/CotA-like multicopper oxidase with cupredoxin domain